MSLDVLLVYELKQTRDMSVFEAVQSNREMRIQYFSDMRDSDYYAPISTKLRAGDDISAEEVTRWRNHLSAVWAITYSEWVQRDIGLTAGYSQLNFTVRLALTTPRSEEFWDELAKNIYPPEFVEFIERERASMQ